MPAVVLLSGGQDSTTCLYWALQAKHGGYRRVHCLSILYGQRHKVELQSARSVVARARHDYPKAEITYEQVEVGLVLTGASPLVSGSELGQYDSHADLPGGVEPTFVPGRNALFLVIAANRAVAVGADTIVTGVCEEDYGGYPDCRRDFVDATEESLSLAMWGEVGRIAIETPLMRLSKAESVRLAAGLGNCMSALALTHTCYAGQAPPCRRCHACILRERGFSEAGIPDPLLSK